MYREHMLENLGELKNIVETHLKGLAAYDLYSPKLTLMLFNSVKEPKFEMSEYSQFSS